MNVLHYTANSNGLFGRCTTKQLMNASPYLIGSSISGNEEDGKKITTDVTLYFSSYMFREMARSVILDKCIILPS